MTEVNITGGGFVTAHGFGTLSANDELILEPGVAKAPKGKEIFKTPLLRYGRFDRYTKLGCAGIALAVRDAGLDEATEKRPIGIILSTEYECYVSDLDYYQTTLEEKGAYTSPNLFSYTLPGIVLGEMAIHFKMTGPTLITGESSTQQRGKPAIDSALDILQAGLCGTVISGWLDSPPEAIAGKEARYGAVFVVLSLNSDKKKLTTIYKETGKIKSGSGQEISSVLDLF